MNNYYYDQKIVWGKSQALTSHANAQTLHGRFNTSSQDSTAESIGMLDFVQDFGWIW